MPVKKDPSGRRWVQAEAEVPGTPEQVWKAIATGPGISSWFVPSEVEERVGGRAVAHFGPGSSMDSVATVTTWDPPRRLVMESASDLGPSGPPVASEWTVEARAGGTCVVRVVHSWFASSEDWDDQFNAAEQGWIAFFRILHLYLAHFTGQACSPLQFMGGSSESVPDAWKAMVDALGISGAATQQRITSSGSAPKLAGTVERVGPAEYPELLVRLDAPAPGVAHMFAMAMGGSTCLSVRLFFYGDKGPGVAAREAQPWQAWMSARFPFADSPAPVA